MDVWGANTFVMRKYNSWTFHLKFVDHIFFQFFRHFPQIKVGGDSAHIAFLEDVPVSPASPSRRRVGCNSTDNHLGISACHLTSRVRIAKGGAVDKSEAFAPTYPQFEMRNSDLRSSWESGVRLNSFYRKILTSPEKVQMNTLVSTCQSDWGSPNDEVWITVRCLRMLPDSWVAG